jgi:hypothetical protein
MATVSFNKAKENKTEVVEEIPAVVEAKAELVPAVQETQLAAPSEQGCGGLEGEITGSDIKLPRINLVQKLGKLGDMFEAGSLVFNKDAVLSTKKDTLEEVTVLRLKKQYQEVLSYDSEEHPRLFDTMAEVREVGGSLFRGEGVLFSEIAHLQVAIKRPTNCSEESESLFCESFDGADYALALWTLAKTAYTASAKRIITTAGNQLKSTGLLGGKWSVSVELRTSDKYAWYVPVFKLTGVHTPEAQQFFRSLLIR